MGLGAAQPHLNNIEPLTQIKTYYDIHIHSVSQHQPRVE